MDAHDGTTERVSARAILHIIIIIVIIIFIIVITLSSAHLSNFPLIQMREKEKKRTKNYLEADVKVRRTTRTSIADLVEVLSVGTVRYVDILTYVSYTYIKICYT